ncbi:MAG: Mfa1 fimbrilin C-terminal domain-containing protein [Prevotella sp.]|nr:Mfa1 fimbrilin C-terminal domain-containing protein [Prevotella sp.]
MKKFSFFTLAAAGMLLAACSSEDAINEQTAGTFTSGDGYVGIAIELPSAHATTRANDDLNNGLEGEFEVKSARLYLFKGANEADATFVQAYNISDAAFEKDTQGATTDAKTQENATKITSTAVKVAKIEKLTLASNEDLYAFVVLNGAGNGYDTDPNVGDKFGEWIKTEMQAANIGGDVTGKISDKGMLMTNAPVSATMGGSQASKGDITVAAKLNKDAIKTTEKDAKDTPAGCVYVERAAAKVTVTDATTDKEIKLTSDEDKMKFEIVGWQVINMEPTFYNARQANVTDWLGYDSDLGTIVNTAKYRFVSADQFLPTLPSTVGHATAFRTYFAQDPNYDKFTDNKLTPTVAGGEGVVWNKTGDNAYITENTFDVANMTSKNTTQVTLQVKFNNGNSFYTISGDPAAYATDKINDAITAKMEKTAQIGSWLAKVNKELSQKDDNKGKEVKGSVKVTVPTEATAGVQELTFAYKFTVGDAEADIDETQKAEWEKAVTEAKKYYTVTCYKDGMSYYNVRIRHFGEAETPWDDIKDADAQADSKAKFKVQPGENVEQIYGYTEANKETANKRFLGRYGVVRDNWYNLSVNSISKLGSATPTSVVDETPDDQIDEEYYISVHVHILPWVLRLQPINL